MFLIDNFVLEKEKVFLIFYIFYTYIKSFIMIISQYIQAVASSLYFYAVTIMSHYHIYI